MGNPFSRVADLQWGTASAFRGAEFNRLYADRWNQVNHPDNEVQYAARTLRARARDLVRNNPYATGIVNAIADNVVGWEGIRLKGRIGAADGEPQRDVNKALERGWDEWCREYATVDGIEDWLETERLLLKSWAVDGEVFVRRRRAWDNPHGFAVELIDPDMLDEAFNEQRERQGREIVMGVELDPHGRPLAYHFWKHHPDAVGRRERVRVPADEITHFFVRYRPGQTRGYSLFAPILTTVEMIDGLTEAELVASRYHASKMGFIYNDTPEAIEAYAARLRLMAQEGKDAPQRQHKIAPGSVPELLPGQRFEGFDPTHPNSAFDPFLRTMMRGVARGFSMSYMTLTGDVSDANYSSQRGALPPERDHWRVLQNIVTRRVHTPVYRDWIGQALLSGAVGLPSPVPSDFYDVTWRGRRWQWVDPLDDIMTTERMIDRGLTSRQRVAADLGHDYEVIVNETSEDLEYAEEQGVDVTGQDATDESGGAPRDRYGDGGESANGNGHGHTNRLAPYPLEAPHGD